VIARLCPRQYIGIGCLGGRGFTRCGFFPAVHTGALGRLGRLGRLGWNGNVGHSFP
jgi:hypothetical protein